MAIMTSLIPNPLIELFIFTYNEAKILPFIISSYQKQLQYVKFTLIDNESDDGTPELAVSLGCKVIVSVTNGKSDNTVRMHYRNNVWKDSQCRWVGVIDADELVSITAEELRKTDFSIITTIGYSIVNKYGEDYSEMVWGFRDSKYDKRVIFDKTRIQEVRFVAGGHRCQPIGDVVFSEKAYPLYHYHYISEDDLVRKYQERQQRRSQADAKRKYSEQYFLSEAEIRDKYQRCLSMSQIVIPNTS